MIARWELAAEWLKVHLAREFRLLVKSIFRRVTASR